jgi:protein involved in sex pheromone biosynthesis
LNEIQHLITFYEESNYLFLQGKYLEKQTLIEYLNMLQTVGPNTPEGDNSTTALLTTGERAKRKTMGTR